MEIKILFAIEDESKKIVDRFSKALLQLGNTTTIQNAAETIVGKITSFSSTGNEEDEYVKQESINNWQTNDVKAESEKTEEVPDVEKEQEEPKKKKAKSETKKTDPVPTVKAEYTRGDLARVGRELANQGKRDEVLKAFTKFHAVSLADIKPEDFNALAQIYIELGGKF